MNGLLDKVRNVVNGGSHAEGDDASSRGRDNTPAHPSHLNPAHEDETRSTSRGRAFASSGRGGAGNMSHSRPRAVDETATEIRKARSTSRSRDRSASSHIPSGTVSGRGGAGNVRSASRDPGSRNKEVEDMKVLEEEERIVEEGYEEKHRGDTTGSGRGGFGNMGHHSIATGGGQKE